MVLTQDELLGQLGPYRLEGITASTGCERPLLVAARDGQQGCAMFDPQRR